MDNGLKSLLTQLTKSSKAQLVGDSPLGLSMPQSKNLMPSAASRLPMEGDARATTVNAKLQPSEVSFGSPSSSTTAGSDSGTDWARLLRQSASSGLAGGLTSGLSSIIGIGGLVTGLLDLFGGGKSTPPPLARFELPESRAQTVAFDSKTMTVEGGAPILGTSGALTTLYTSSPSVSTQSQQAAYITQAVKNALLHSSSLNDVIADL
jgi:hypothetical protein